MNREKRLKQIEKASQEQYDTIMKNARDAWKNVYGREEDDEEQVLNMKILTCKISESYTKAMEKLIGEDRIYSSRSELIREAVRRYLLKELTRINSLNNQPVKQIKLIIKKTSNWENKTGNLRISIENPNIIFITGFGLVKRVENPSKSIKIS